jgi:CheY-like chemotaxis protein
VIADELSGLRVLVVDDSNSAADMLGIALEHMGCNVRVVYGGEAAINAAAESPPQVVVMDIGMPGIDGYEAARRIRQEPWGKEITLIALTGWGLAEDKRRARDAGFDHHLVKPPVPDELRKLLAEVTSK